MCPSANKNSAAPKNPVLLTGNLQADTKKIHADFGNSCDLIVNTMTYGKPSYAIATVYISDLVKDMTLDSISEELSAFKLDNARLRSDTFFEQIRRAIAKVRAPRSGSDFDTLYMELLDGNTVFIVEGNAEYFSLETSSDEGRAITEPTSQTIIKGPKDAFTEDINKNTFLIRSRIRNEALRVESVTLGTVTHTKIRMLFINGIAKASIVDDIRKRLSEIVYDGILDSGYIEALFKTDVYSIFPTSLNSERPDSVSAALLEGRIAIIVSGSPYVITVPAIFSDFMQASEDYYQSFYIATFIRILRYAALLLTLLVPALFVALTTFHQEIVPTPLLISIAAQREGAPFPAFLEVLTMELAFEIIREAGIRMPRAIGPAISIVGALVLGQAAVEAGLITGLVVIIVSVTAISSFAIANYSMSNAIRLLRFAFIIIAAGMGLYGISMGLILLVLHLCKVKSAGVPYLTPIAPWVKGENKDTLLLYPLWALKKRPGFTSAGASDKTSGPAPLSPVFRGKQELN